MFQSRKVHKEEVNWEAKEQKKAQAAAEAQRQHQREPITKSKKCLGVPAYVERKEGSGTTHPTQQSPKTCLQDIPALLQKPKKTFLKGEDGINYEDARITWWPLLLMDYPTAAISTKCGAPYS